MTPTEVAERRQEAGDGRPAATPAGPRKRLLYLAVCDPDLPVTGATVRMGAFVRHLARFYDVALVNMGGSGHRVEADIEARYRDRDNRLGVTERARVGFSRSGYFLFSPTLYREAARRLRATAFDYLLADYGLAAVYGRLLARRHRVPLIYSSHNIEYRAYYEQTRYDARRGLLAPYVWAAERAACRAARLVVAISEGDAAAYARWIPAERIEVVPQGFDPDVVNPYYPAPPASPAVVLFVGNFRAEHNRQAARQVVRDVVPPVVRARPGTTFQLVGADPPPELAGPHVECTGFVDDLAPYLRRANLVVAPMPYAYGMSTKIVSALAFGKPVLTTPEGAGSISRHYRQLVVSPLDGFAARAVELLATGPAVDAAEFPALCREFAWPRLIERLHRRIEETCRRDDRPLQSREARGEHP
jgi:glycosyltransferase involved in cell wall biosynthesis